MIEHNGFCYLGPLLPINTWEIQNCGPNMRWTLDAAVWRVGKIGYELASAAVIDYWCHSMLIVNKEDRDICDGL